MGTFLNVSLVESPSLVAAFDYPSPADSFGFASSPQPTQSLQIKRAIQFRISFPKFKLKSWLVLDSQNNNYYFSMFNNCFGNCICTFNEECFWGKRNIIWAYYIWNECFPYYVVVFGSSICFLPQHLSEKRKMNKQRKGECFPGAEERRMNKQRTDSSA